MKEEFAELRINASFLIPPTSVASVNDTQAPLSLPGTLSTAGHWDQSSTFLFSITAKHRPPLQDKAELTENRSNRRCSGSPTLIEIANRPGVSAKFAALNHIFSAAAASC